MRQQTILTKKDNMSSNTAMDISPKIIKIMKGRGMTAAQAERESGGQIKATYLRKMLDGSRKWRLDYLESLSKTLKIPIAEFFREGEPPPFEALQPLITVLGTTPEIPRELHPEEYLAVPLVEGRIAAGYAGAIPGDYVEGLVWVHKPELGSREHHNLRAVRLDKKARSMIPTLRPGDIVIIDPVEKPPGAPLSRKAIYAVKIDREGGCALKRVKEAGPFWLLLSDNPEEEPFVLEKSRYADLIIGRVIWSWTRWI